MENFPILRNSIKICNFKRTIPFDSDLLILKVLVSKLVISPLIQ